MLSKKNIKWIDKKCKSLIGKTVVVTGANSGIGFKTCETLIYLGANVIMACRNLSKAFDARSVLLRDYPNANVKIMSLDLADFKSIDNFISELKKIDIDCFVNNAGVFNQPNKKTKDGFELVLGTNYFGVYYLSEKLLPYLSSLNHDIYYINTISIIHKIGNIKYDDFYYKNRYNKFNVYARSKICLAKYTYYLAMKYKNSNIKVYMNHPGISITPLGLNAFDKISDKFINLFKFMFNSPEKSSLSVVDILSDNYDIGSIIGPNFLFGGWGYPKKNRICKKVFDFNELIDFTEKEIGGVFDVF